MFVITEDLVLLVLVSLCRNIKLKHTTNEMQKKKKYSVQTEQVFNHFF